VTTSRPRITAAIIGPRTMEHLESQLTAADIALSARVLDRIDEINPPGVTINHPTTAGPHAGCSPPTGAARRHS
jgi:hypothetical protein